MDEIVRLQLPSKGSATKVAAALRHEGYAVKQILRDHGRTPCQWVVVAEARALSALNENVLIEIGAGVSVGPVNGAA